MGEKLEKLQDVTVEAICQAVQGHAASGKSPEEILEDAVRWLYELYEKTDKKEYLVTAKRTIQAYMELGLIYERKQDLFDRVFSALGEERCICFPKMRYSSNAIRCNSTQLRMALGYWPSTSEKEFVVRQMMEKIRNKEIGASFFRCKSNDNLFELLIIEEGIYLIDFRKNQINSVIQK